MAITITLCGNESGTSIYLLTQKEWKGVARADVIVDITSVHPHHSDLQNVPGSRRCGFPAHGGDVYDIKLIFTVDRRQDHRVPILIIKLIDNQYRVVETLIICTPWRGGMFLFKALGRTINNYDFKKGVLHIIMSLYYNMMNCHVEKKRNTSTYHSDNIRFPVISNVWHQIEPFDQ